MLSAVCTSPANSFAVRSHHVACSGRRLLSRAIIADSKRISAMKSPSPLTPAVVPSQPAAPGETSSSHRSYAARSCPASVTRPWTTSTNMYPPRLLGTVWRASCGVEGGATSGPLVAPGVPLGDRCFHPPSVTAQNLPMSYPNPRYQGASGELSAAYRGVDTGSPLTVRSGTQVHYLATGAGTDGEFGLYRWDMAGPPAGPTPHFHRTFSESFYILSGTVQLFDGHQWKSGVSGDFMFVPEGGVHA